ncbi:MAG: hypothetical protein JOZ58_16010 [Acetobacteraceae bacterium]|nr:hypothetical protein [Acetobacteraceae bacterium]
MSDSDINPKFIERIDASKRSSIRKMVLGTAFVVPAVVSFSMSGLTVSEAFAANSGITLRR